MLWSARKTVKYNIEGMISDDVSQLSHSTLREGFWKDSFQHVQDFETQSSGHPKEIIWLCEIECLIYCLFRNF